MGDQVKIRVNMNAEDMDTFVFCLAHKKSAGKMVKEMQDLMTYCPEKRPVQEKFGLPNTYFVMSEIPEVSMAMLSDSKLLAMLNKYPDAIDSIHFSDQYSGPKPMDDQQTQQDLPESRKALIFTFNITGMNAKKSIEDSVEDLKPLMLLVLYFIDKIKRFRLSREAKNKADKNRTKVQEAFWKSIHAAKGKKAAEERERRELKERIKEIEDPDKQRKMEEREIRRDRKKAAPKMKQMKVKAM